MPYNKIISNDEVAVKEIIDLLIENWKALIVAGLLGLLASVSYIVVTPNKFESTFEVIINDEFFQLKIFNYNLLKNHIKSPSSYNKHAIKDCGYEGNTDSAQLLADVVNLSFNANSKILQLKVEAFSSEMADRCAHSVARIIGDYLMVNAENIVKDSRVKLLRYSQEIKLLESFKENPDGIKNSDGLFEFNRFREIRIINDRLEYFQSLIVNLSSNPIKIFKIYSPKDKIQPRPIIILSVGIIVGIFLCLLLIFGRHFILQKNRQIVDG